MPRGNARAFASAFQPTGTLIGAPSRARGDQQAIAVAVRPLRR